MNSEFLHSTSQPGSGFGQPHPSRQESRTRPERRGQGQRDFAKGKYKGVNSYSKRGAETTHTFLTRDTEAHYVDTRALFVPGQPEKRRYPSASGAASLPALWTAVIEVILPHRI